MLLVQKVLILLQADATAQSHLIPVNLKMHKRSDQSLAHTVMLSA